VELKKKIKDDWKTAEGRDLNRRGERVVDGKKTKERRDRHPCEEKNRR